MVEKVNGKRGLNRNKSRLLFYILILALPVLQFAIFYIYVNFNSIVMAFTSYKENPDGFGYTTSFAGFANFVTAFKKIVSSSYMIKNALWLFLVQLFIGMPLALIFSFYIYKKHFMHKTFQVILFLPQIVSGVVFALLFMYLAEEVYVTVMNNYFHKPVEYGLIGSPDVNVRRTTILIYTVWMSFGVNVLLFTGAMSGINDSVVEAARMDGANLVQEFIHITIPMIFPTISTFIILAIAGIFTEQMHLYTFYSTGAAELSTTGYYLFVQAKVSKIIIDDPNKLSYSALAAYGLIITAVLLPVSMLVRKLLTKFGPNAG